MHDLSQKDRPHHRHPPGLQGSYVPFAGELDKLFVIYCCLEQLFQAGLRIQYFTAALRVSLAGSGFRRLLCGCPGLHTMGNGLRLC